MTFFNDSTTEHEQDGFISWLCDNFSNSTNMYLQRLSKLFVDFLITPYDGYPFISNYQVESVERQRYKIDVLLTLTTEKYGKYYVIIEDKIDSQEHGEQLLKYVEKLKKGDKVSEERIFVVYYKTGHIVKSDGELSYDNIYKVWKTGTSPGEYYRVRGIRDKISVGLNIIDIERINSFFSKNKQIINDCNNIIVSDYVDYIKGRYNQICPKIITSESPAFLWVRVFDEFICGIKNKTKFHNSLRCKVASFTVNDPELQITWFDETDVECCKYPVMCIHSKDLCLSEPFIRFQNKRGAKDTAICFVNPVNNRNGDQIMKYGFQYGHFKNNVLNSITNPLSINDIHKLLDEICDRYCDVVSGKANKFDLMK